MEYKSTWFQARDKAFDEWASAAIEQEERAIMGPKPKGKQPVFIKGDVVEFKNAAGHSRVGIVTFYKGLTHTVQVTDFSFGDILVLPGEDCALIHGYLHIDRSERKEF